MANQYDQHSPQVDKFLQPDGSVQTAAGVVTQPANAKRAEDYKRFSPHAAKWLQPDGSITDELPVSGGGGSGNDGATFTPQVQQQAVDEVELSWSNDKGLPNPAPVTLKAQAGKDGAPGAQGAAGTDGANGFDGATFTPSVVSVASDEIRLEWSNDQGLSNPQPISIKAPKGDDGATGPPGMDGQDGQAGQEGATFTPSVTQIDTDEIQLAWLNDRNLPNPAAVRIKARPGPAGEAGAAGADGQNGADGAQGPPGNDGRDGTNGITYTPHVAANSANEIAISWTNDGGASNPLPVTLTAPEGVQGIQGAAGEQGATFAPVSTQIDTDEIAISWSNDKGLPNPLAVTLKAPKGDAGAQGEPGPKAEFCASTALLSANWAQNGDTGLWEYSVDHALFSAGKTPLVDYAQYEDAAAAGKQAIKGYSDENGHLVLQMAEQPTTDFHVSILLIDTSIANI